MKIQYIKLFLIGLLGLILFAFALPEFTFQVGSNTVRYPSIGFSRIGIPRDFGSFQRSSGLFADAKYYAQISFDSEEVEEGTTIETISDEQKWEISNAALRTIQNRLNYANLYDITAEVVKEDVNFYIALTFPQYYQNQANYVEWITAPGDLNLITSSSSLNLNDVLSAQVTQNLKIAQTSGTIRQIQAVQVPNIALTFDTEDDGTEFLRLFSTLEIGADGAIAQLTIDGAANFLPYAEADSGNIIKFIPNVQGDNKSVQDYLKLVTSYFQEEQPLSLSIVFTDRIENVSPLFNPEGGAFISITLTIGMILIMLFVLRKLKIEKGIRFITIFLLTQLSVIFLLKLTIAYLSITTLVAYLICSVILAFVVYRIAKSDDITEDKEVKHFTMTLSAVLLIIFTVVYKLELPIGKMADAIGIILVFNLILFLMSVTSFLDINNTMRRVLNSRK